MTISLDEVLGRFMSTIISSEVNVANDILIPAFKTANSVDILAGYFSSQSFSEIAPGLATYLNQNSGKIRLVISPNLTKEDLAITNMSDDERRKYLSHVIFDIDEGADHIIKYTLACFAWLLEEQRLEIKIAFLKNNGLFHPKVFIFNSNNNSAVLSGSINFTKSGIRYNIENLNLSRSWESKASFENTEYLKNYFEKAFNDEKDDLVVYDLDDAVKKNLINKYSGEINRKPKELNWLVKQEIEDRTKPRLQEIKIPEHLIYDKGDFKHQGEALNAWKNAGMTGILDMATGAGKTITSLICAHEFQQTHGCGMFFISAPQTPLILQWVDEVKEFGLTPQNLSKAKDWNERTRHITDAQRKLKRQVSRAEIFVISNTLLKREEFSKIIRELTVPVMLIADECHNFGLDFLEEDINPLIKGKLGLSATPERQYDLKGTEFLTKFFGDICFKFSLDDAIGKCLTPYDYHIVPVYLDSEEMLEFSELTAKINSLMWQSENEDSPQLDQALRDRRKVIETASLKIPALRNELTKLENGVRHTLVYCTDKNPEQLEQVNAVLRENNFKYRQITQEETSSVAKTQLILRNFRAGVIEILTAKRVLDEGVNIPETMRAYVLASNTVERQWTQRRGRILRKCKEINKEFAEIFDFVVLPPSLLDENNILSKDDKQLIKSELKRITEFAKLSRNKTSPNGPNQFLNRLNVKLGETINAT